MAGGINLTLMIGPAVPVPVPKVVLDALSSIQVTTAVGQASGFQLTFELGSSSPLYTLFTLDGGGAIPMIRVIIAVTVNGSPEVLMDGVMTNHELNPGNDSAPATLIVTGEDISKVMDYIDFSGIPYPAMPAEARVALILAKYAVLGIVPVVIPTLFSETPLPTDRIPLQKGKDLEYVRQLAKEVGYVFYIAPGPKPGMSIAYWGPDIKIGTPQPALNTKMDAYTNVESLSFNLNADAKKQPVVFIQEPISKQPLPIPIPDISMLNPALGATSLLAKTIEPITDAANRSPIAAIMAGISAASNSADGISANGTLDVIRYGHVLKARRLVGLRGAGSAFDGVYYTKSVTHNIKPGEYKQSFTLTRNALGSLVSSLPI